MEVPQGRHWAHLPGLLAALQALAEHLERQPQGAGAADAFHALRQQGAPQAQLVRPALLRPLAALAASGGHPQTARLAAKLLRALAEAGPECCAAVRAAGGIEALTRLAGRAAGGAEGLTRDDALAAEAAVEALRTLLARGAPAASAAAAEVAAGDPDGLRLWASGDFAQALSDGGGGLAASSAEERDWLQASLAFRAAGGVPAAVALLAFGPDRRIVRDALAILAALLCGEEATISDAAIDARAAAAAEFQAAGGLAALTGIVAAGGAAPRAQSAVGKALRLLRDVVAASGAALPAVQAAGGISAVISVLDSSSSRNLKGGSLQDQAAPDLGRLAHQTLAVFGRQYKPPELKQLGFDSPQLQLRASMDSTERVPGVAALNWSASGAAGRDVNSIHVSDAGSERTSDHSGSDASSDAADTQAGDDDESNPEFSHVPPSPSPAFMRSKALYTTNSAAEGKGPLHWAAQFGEATTLARLLAVAVDPSPRDGAGNTPLHLAALNSHTECVRVLLWGGADAMAFNAAEALPLDLADSARPAWAALEQELQWRTCLQASHPCELIWDHADRPLPLLHGDSRRASRSLGDALQQQRAGSDAGGSGFATPNGGGSAAGGPGARASPGSAPSDRDQSGMQCYFDALTGEVVVSSRTPQSPQPAASLVGKKKHKGGLRRRLLACTCSSSGSGGNLAAGAAPPLATRLLSHRLRAEPLDKLAVYVALDAPDPVLGEGAEALPEGVPVGVAVRLCGAAELAAALQLMQARLHPALAQAQAAVAALRGRQADHAFTPKRRAREADAALTRHSTEARLALEALLQQARRLEAQFAACSLQGGPAALPRAALCRRDRASLHARLLRRYLEALGQPPPRGAATHPVEVPALLDVDSPWRELGPPAGDGGGAPWALNPGGPLLQQPGMPASPASSLAEEQPQAGQQFTPAGDEPSGDTASAPGSPQRHTPGQKSAHPDCPSSSVGRWSASSTGSRGTTGTGRRSSGVVRRPNDGVFRSNVAALSDEFRAIAKRLDWAQPTPQPPAPQAAPAKQSATVLVTAAAPGSKASPAPARAPVSNGAGGSVYGGGGGSVAGSIGGSRRVSSDLVQRPKQLRPRLTPMGSTAVANVSAVASSAAGGRRAGGAGDFSSQLAARLAATRASTAPATNGASTAGADDDTLAPRTPSKGSPLAPASLDTVSERQSSFAPEPPTPPTLPPNPVARRLAAQPQPDDDDSETVSIPASAAFSGALSGGGGIGGRGGVGNGRLSGDGGGGLHSHRLSVDGVGSAPGSGTVTPAGSRRSSRADVASLRRHLRFGSGVSTISEQHVPNGERPRWR